MKIPPFICEVVAISPVYWQRQLRKGFLFVYSGIVSGWQGVEFSFLYYSILFYYLFIKGGVVWYLVSGRSQKSG